MPAAQKEIVRIKETIKQWSKNYRKQCIRRFWQKEEEDIDKLATPEEIRKFDSSKAVRNTGKNKFLPKFVNILGKLWKAEFSLNTTNIVIFYFQEYSNIGNI